MKKAKLNGRNVKIIEPALFVEDQNEKRWLSASDLPTGDFTILEKGFLVQYSDGEERFVSENQLTFPETVGKLSSAQTEVLKEMVINYVITEAAYELIGRKQSFIRFRGLNKTTIGSLLKRGFLTGDRWRGAPTQKAIDLINYTPTDEEIEEKKTNLLWDFYGHEFTDERIQALGDLTKELDGFERRDALHYSQSFSFNGIFSVGLWDQKVRFNFEYNIFDTNPNWDQITNAIKAVEAKLKSVGTIEEFAARNET